MVFQKKAASAVKMDQVKKKGKKVVQQEEYDDLDMSDMEDMDDSEDDSSSEETQVQKTPQNKTPKGKQPLSERKVSFKVTGNNTPAKTPNKENSALAKKQSTPGSKNKTAVQEFQGMKGIQNNKSKKRPADDEDDDDDDEDDDDDDDDEDDDLDLQLDDDDDDDDDDDEDEEDDDDEDDDEDEEESKGKTPSKAMTKQKDSAVQNKQTPAKGANKAKNAETPKATPNMKKEVKNENSPKRSFTQEQNIEIERRRERDLKMLYIGGLPKDTKPLELKALSPDIQDCIMPHGGRQRENKTAFAFLLFASEKKAEENYKTLQTKKFRGQLLNVDFVGEKSKNRKPTQINEPKNFNMKKLFITGIPLDTTLDKVAKFFPKAYQVAFNLSPTTRSASVLFTNEEDANEAFKANTDIAIDGNKLTVLHALMGKANKKHKRRKSGGKFQNKNMTPGGKAAKRIKKEATSDD